MKKLLTFTIFLLIIVIAVILAKDVIVKVSIEKGVELVTGLKLEMARLRVGIFKPVIDIANFTLLNPKGFADRTMMQMPEIYVRYDLPAIASGKIHLPEVRLALKEFLVIKNAQGELNLDALKTVQAQKTEKSPSQKAPGKMPPIKIDLLKLSIGKVMYKDYSKAGAPSIKEFNINLAESYTNVEDPYALASLIVVKALMNTSIAALANFDLKGLQQSAGEVFSGAQEITSKAVATTQETATQAVDKVSETMKGLLKNPFGSDK